MLMLAVPVVAATESNVRESVELESFGVTITDAYLTKELWGDPVDPKSFKVGDQVCIVFSMELTRGGNLTEILWVRGPTEYTSKITNYHEPGTYWVSSAGPAFAAKHPGRGTYRVILWLHPIGFATVSLPYSAS